MQTLKLETSAQHDTGSGDETRLDCCREATWFLTPGQLLAAVAAVVANDFANDSTVLTYV